MKSKRVTLAALATACLGTAANAVLFADNFNTDTSASWAVNKSSVTAVSSATFGFDYSTYGIPSAPNSSGDTHGLKMDANTNAATQAFSGLSASPLGQSFTGDYEMRADVWMNFVGPAPGGGSGSTQAGGMGIGTAGATAQWAGGAQDSIHFSHTTDGNSSFDWRAYSSAAASGYADASTVYAAAGAGNRNNSHGYYSSFIGQAAPAAQTTLFGTQTGTALNGTLAFGWHDMRVKKAGNMVTWSVDGKLIATVDASTVTLGGNNILLTYFDTNTTASTAANKFLNCMIVDNLQVVPEPSTWLALGFGSALLLRRRARKS